MFPDPYVVIDETLYSTRGKIVFKTYNKDKPAKYGLNFQSLRSSNWSYIYGSVPYASKPSTVTNTHVTKFDDLVIKIFDGYERFLHSVKGVNITMDRYYTLIPDAKHLVEKNITIFGALKANRKALPPAIKETRDRD